MPKRRKGDGGLDIAGTLDPNSTGPDPMFGNVEDLPKGVKRQTSIHALVGDKATGRDRSSGAYWSRITIRFPECLGIKETISKAKLDIAKRSCIPVLGEDLPINLPVIVGCKVELLRPPSQFITKVEGGVFDSAFTNTVGIKLSDFNNRVAFILTGDDQLTTKCRNEVQPVNADKPAEVTVTKAQQIASLSNTIYAKFYEGNDPQNMRDFTHFTQALPWWSATADALMWLFGKYTDPAKEQNGLTYKDLAQMWMGKQHGFFEKWSVDEINNIQDKGYLLLKDYVNLWCKVPGNAIEKAGQYIFKLTIDYVVRTATLSQVLLWQKKVTEFIPKELKWRGYDQAAGDKHMAWKTIVSRGSLAETGVGIDVSSKTNFPDITE